MASRGTLGAKRSGGGLQAVLLFLALVAFTACAASGDSPENEATLSLSGRPWPEADRLFRQDARWLGADDAHSVDLGKGRVLWLFGDTLIDPEGKERRSRVKMIRNSIGIQNGYDPTKATMAFFWGQMAAPTPTSFFPETGQTWFWPGDGIRIGRVLLVFLTVIEPSASDLGFVATGWQAVKVSNPDAPPGRWQISAVSKKADTFAIMLGTGGLLRCKGYLYAYGTNPDGNRAYLARWHEETAAAGDLREPEWWCGVSRKWKEESLMDGEPAALFSDSQAEFGVHFEPRINRYVQVQTMGFGAAEMGFRIALRPEGPWGSLAGFYSPEEGSIPGVLIYAAKSHPFLTGADLVISYATNHIDPERLNDYPALYYPRMLKGDF